MSKRVNQTACAEIAGRFRSFLAVRFQDNQSTLAEHLDVPQPIISRVAAAKQLPGSPILLALARRTRLRLSWLMTGVGQMEDVAADLTEERMHTKLTKAARAWLQTKHTAAREYVRMVLCPPQQLEIITPWNNEDVQVVCHLPSCAFAATLTFSCLRNEAVINYPIRGGSMGEIALFARTLGEVALLGVSLESWGRHYDDMEPMRPKKG